MKIDQKGFRFVPHVTVVVTGSTIRFLNNDPEPHNVYSPEGRYNLGTWPTGETKDYTFKKPGCTPSCATSTRTCWLSSWWSTRRTSPSRTPPGPS